VENYQMPVVAPFYAVAMMNPARKRLVVVVDDDYVVREELIRVLEDEPDLRALGTSGAEGALAATAEEGVAVVLIDLQLPDDGARAVIDALRGRGVALVGMSARGGGLALAAELDLSAVLDKPFPPERLVPTIRAAFDRLDG
jgi:two-component system OmpR family response regulator